MSTICITSCLERRHGFVVAADLDKTMVLKVTFGWENAKLPRSVVLKICDRHEEDFPEEADELASKLFWR